MKNKHSISSITINLMCMLLFAMYGIGCSDSPFNPTGGENPPPDGSTTTFGLVEVTFSGIGTNQMTATAQPAHGNTAAALTRPSGSGGANDGTIQIESISHGSFTTGSRTDGTGMRYLYATFMVRNADVDGNPYPGALQNLTFVAVDTDASADAIESYGVTPISELRLFDGSPLNSTQAQTIAQALIPTGRVEHDPASGTGYLPYKADVLQIFTETEAAAITVPNGVTAFPYGFITRSPKTSPGSRKLPAGPGQYEFDGIVTFAYKMPLQAQANQDPFEIKALFLPVEDSEARITQSLEEQTPQAAARTAGRAADLNALYVSVLPGTNFRAAFPIRRLCGPVRVAGNPPPATPVTVLFPEPPMLQSITPDPHAADGSASSIPVNTSISAVYDKAVNAANSRNFVVRGSQSGLLFTGGGYTSAGATVTSPPGNYFPGEIINVTLTSGLGSCLPSTARFRVSATGGSSTFSDFTETTMPAGSRPTAVMSGDWNGDGDLDLAVTNFFIDTIYVLENGGAGGFTIKTTVPVGGDPYAIIADDWDSDGDLDLAVANANDDNVSLLENDGDGSFSQTTVPVGDGPATLTSGDWNGDGDPDLAIPNNLGDTISLLENDGLGGFSQTAIPVGDGPASVTGGDWDSDGDLDLAIPNKLDDTVSLLENDGLGGFSQTTVPVGDGPISVTAGDWNGDGDLDLVVTSTIDNTISLLENNGAGVFTAATPLAVGTFPVSVIAGDWNGDGYLDLAVVNYTNDSVSMLKNNGSGGFITKTPITVGVLPISITAGDWDGDGDLDLAVTNVGTGGGDASVSLLTNQ